MIISLHSRKHRNFITNILHVPTIISSDNNTGSCFVLYIMPFMEKKKQLLGCLLFLNIMQYSLIFGYWSLGTAQWSRLSGTSISWTEVQEMLDPYYPNYQSMLVNISEGRWPYLHHSRSLKSLPFGDLTCAIHLHTVRTGTVFPVHHQLLLPNTVIKFTLFSFDIINFSIYIYYFNIHFWNLSLFQ